MLLINQCICFESLLHLINSTTSQCTFVQKKFFPYFVRFKISKFTFFRSTLSFICLNVTHNCHSQMMTNNFDNIFLNWAFLSVLTTFYEASVITRNVSKYCTKIVSNTEVSKSTIAFLILSTIISSVPVAQSQGLLFY